MLVELLLLLSSIRDSENYCGQTIAIAADDEALSGAALTASIVIDKPRRRYARRLVHDRFTGTGTSAREYLSFL